MKWSPQVNALFLSSYESADICILFLMEQRKYLYGNEWKLWTPVPPTLPSLFQTWTKLPEYSTIRVTVDQWKLNIIEISFVQRRSYDGNLIKCTPNATPDRGAAACHPSLSWHIYIYICILLAIRPNLTHFHARTSARSRSEIGSNCTIWIVPDRTVRNPAVFVRYVQVHLLALSEANARQIDRQILWPLLFESSRSTCTIYL